MYSAARVAVELQRACEVGLQHARTASPHVVSARRELLWWSGYSDVCRLHTYWNVLLPLIIIIFLNPEYKIPEGKILKTKQVRPQRLTTTYYYYTLFFLFFLIIIISFDPGTVDPWCHCSDICCLHTYWNMLLPVIIIIIFFDPR